jgi:hypothetical protein
MRASGDESSETLSRFVDRRDSIVNVEGLTFAKELASDRFDDRTLVVLSDVGGESGRRSTGRVVAIEMSRMPTRAISRVRGVGLALSVNTSRPEELAS